MKILKKIAFNKKQSNNLIALMRKYYNIIDPAHANKLTTCSNVIGIEFHEGKICRSKPLACFSPLCPVCINRKVRTQMAITAQCFNKISLMPEYSDYHYYHICLTVRDYPVNDVGEGVDMINNGFNRLSRRVTWKHNIVGDSRFYHFGLNSNNRVHPHIHIMALVKPNHGLSAESISLHWAEALHVDYLPKVYFMHLCEQNHREINHPMNLVGYGLKMVKYREIFKYPDTYFKLMNQIKFEADTKSRFVSHRGLFLKTRGIVEKEYKEGKQINPEADQIMVCKFDGNNYYQDQLIQL